MELRSVLNTTAAQPPQAESGPPTATTPPTPKATSTSLAAPSLDQWRTNFAIERTLLSWTRTAIALMGLGFILARFGLFLRELTALQQHQAETQSQTPLWLGITLVLMGTVILVSGAHRYSKTLKKIAPGTELATATVSRTPFLMALCLAGFGIALSVYLFQLRSTPSVPDLKQANAAKSQANAPVDPTASNADPAKEAASPQE